ncbi:MAG: RNA polymerase [Thermoplasmata archaeon]|nr:MAG: RNA polymerase [Thermoplasmata archaeon]
MDEKLRYLSLAEVKNILEKEEKKRELSYEQNLALDHAKHFAKLGVTKARKMAEELMKIERITEPFANKIVDILPLHPDEVRAIFAKERFTLEEKEIKKIIEIVEKYR